MEHAISENVLAGSAMLRRGQYQGGSILPRGAHGQVDAGFGDTSSTVELVKAGRVKALAHSSSGRLPSLPEVPSMTEAGYPFKNYSWYGIFAPAKTPPAIVARLNEQVLRALRDPALIQRMRELNFSDLPLTTPEQFTQTLRQDLDDWSQLVKETGVQLD